ncbi:MAG: hypothetical protein DMD72_05595, partial [Gemmatimonadetes bacterium]
RVDAATLNARAAAVNLPIRDRQLDRDYPFLVTEPASWESTKLLLAELEALNATPFVARYEISDRGEELQ